MKLAVLILVLILQSSLLAKKEIVVATVNGQAITKTQLEDYHRSRLLQFSNRKITKLSSLKDLINREMTLQKARKAKLANEPKVKDQMENVLYEAQIAQDLNSEFLKIKTTDKEIQKYYKENPEYRTSLILLRLPAQPEPAQVKDVYERAIKVYQEAKAAPQKFDEIAMKNSQLSLEINTNAPDIGFQPASKLPPEYFQAIHNKPMGSITLPFRTQFGFNIVKILEVKPSNQINSDFYKAVLFNLKKQEIMDKYFSKLKNNTRIKVNLK